MGTGKLLSLQAFSNSISKGDTLRRPRAQKARVCQHLGPGAAPSAPAPGQPPSSASLQRAAGARTPPGAPAPRAPDAAHGQPHGCPLHPFRPLPRSRHLALQPRQALAPGRAAAQVPLLCPQAGLCVHTLRRQLQAAPPLLLQSRGLVGMRRAHQAPDVGAAASAVPCRRPVRAAVTPACT